MQFPVKCEQTVIPWKVLTLAESST